MNLRTPHPFGGTKNRKPHRLLGDRHSRQPELIRFAERSIRVRASTHQAIGDQDDFPGQGARFAHRAFLLKSMPLLGLGKR